MWLPGAQGTGDFTRVPQVMGFVLMGFQGISFHTKLGMATTPNLPNKETREGTKRRRLNSMWPH